MRSNRLFSLALILFLLAGCAPGQPAQSAPRVPEQTFTPTATQPEATHTPTETAQPMLTPTPAGCQESGGRVERFTLDSAAVGRPLGVRVYTPPCYDAAQLPGYPVLYLLHGQHTLQYAGHHQGRERFMRCQRAQAFKDIGRRQQPRYGLKP